ncbi:cellulose binding domain-containing protein [Microbispora sp. NPDC046933]|uniref:cellulose binding domain-containing protein n=1 Tax=Microbispora sp. NPDC046933 TaxID=3155618 RepID=UPI0033E13350
MRFLRRSSGIGSAGLLLAALLTGPAQAAPAGVPTGYDCAVTYATHAWPGGFTAQVTISNTGTRVFSPWILQFVFPGSQTITTAWNATYSVTPPSVQAASSWYKSIDPGTSFTIGFNANGVDDHPTGFTFNGVPCAVSYESLPS